MASRPIGTIADDARQWAQSAELAGEEKCAQLAWMAANVLDLARQEYEKACAVALPFPSPEAPGTTNVGQRVFLCCTKWLDYPTPGNPTTCPECGSIFELGNPADWSPRVRSL